MIDSIWNIIPQTMTNLFFIYEPVCRKAPATPGLLITKNGKVVFPFLCVPRITKSCHVLNVVNPKICAF